MMPFSTPGYFVTVLISVFILIEFYNLDGVVSHSNRIDSSFRRLESGENSDEEINQCCSRESRFVTIGHGLNAEEIRVDVGFCRQKCEPVQARPLKREEFDKLLKKYPDADPIQIFLSLRNQQRNEEVENQLPLLLRQNHTVRTSSDSCTASICQPLVIRREMHFDLSGHQKLIDVVDSCDCIRLPSSCQKVQFLVKLHAGTPYEKQLDLGKCVGPCSSGDEHGNDPEIHCRSIQNRTTTVEGPNGAECMEVIQECQCVGDCFRSREQFRVYDYIHVFESKANATMSGEDEEEGGEAEDTIEPVTKIIDIGQCHGRCSGSQELSKCVLRSERNETCLSSLYGGKSQCAADKFTSHSYVDKLGQKRTLISVTSCGCR